MDCIFTQLPYGETGYFSNIVTAYLGNDERLRPFYRYPVSHEGAKESIDARGKFSTDRQLLVRELRNQYSGVEVSSAVRDNIDLLLEENTFTVCTAHQPAIFTGNLFFIYKILHAIKLARHYKKVMPENNFVPVFYMGCEDADIDELGNIYLGGEKIVWDTKQKGAVGRMNTKGLEKIIRRIEGELSVQPFGKELVELLKECYLNTDNVQNATFKLVNALFAEYGLIVLIPDNAGFKKAMVPVFEDELFNRVSSGIVEKTGELIGEHFKMQAHPRQINLFYLKDDIRERIDWDGENYTVVNTDIVFTAEEIKKELHEHPERFSPNVILRGIMQETILPNIAFIGGGGELAYWMELKGVFERYKVPYPILVLRNSFLIMERKWKEKLDRLQITIADLFKPTQQLLNGLVKRESDKKLTLAEEIVSATSYYDHLKYVAQQVDDTLTGHVAALQTRALKPLHELEKKLLRAEKRKFEAQERQLNALKNALFPNNSLQERVENFMPFYAKWGRDFIKMVYDHSFTVEQQFVVLTVND
jgi:bacillithiol biosynthesis cysteine-adding enzyme BshC